jgi:PhnB protein
MAFVNPYIHFNGNAEEAFTFYRSVFGGEFTQVSRYKDLSSPNFTIPEKDANRILHIILPTGKNSAIMASDTVEMMGQVTENDNRNAIFISAESREEADRLFAGLTEGGKVEMPISLGPWGNYFGMFTDKFGVEWMIDFDSKRN